MRKLIGGVLVVFALVPCVLLICSGVSGHPDEQLDEITLERVQIFVKLENGTTFSLMMEPNDTVLSLLEDISQYEGVPWNRFRLQSDNVWLEYTARLSDYNIQAGTTVTLVVPENQDRRTIDFVVRTHQGRDVPVVAALGDTVASLKENITQLTGVPHTQKRLLRDGKELKDERKLIYYGIDYDTTLNLGPPLEDWHQVVYINVITLSGVTIKVEVRLADTVAALKETIWMKAGVPTGVQRLFANKRVITGEDRLGDRGLATGSTVYMILYSSRITSPDQVASLQEPPVACFVNNHRAPIFREADDIAEAEQSRRPVSPYKDARNWVAWDDPRPGWNPVLFDPVAYLTPHPDREAWIQEYHDTFEGLSRSDASEEHRIEAVRVLARIKLSSAMRPYRAAAKFKSDNNCRQSPGISLGGGSTDVSPKQLIPLGVDVNNWAPDAFGDSDVMRLFEVSERVRQVLARDAQTGEGTLGIATQRRINRAILSTYLEALAGYPPPVEYDQPSEDEECGICRDNLRAEPANKLTCGHTFHADCILPWATNLYQEERVANCPFCRQRFLLPYEAQGKAELATPDLQVNQLD